MKYIFLLWPHANVRYRNETCKLAEAELKILLGRVAPETEIARAEVAGLPALKLNCPKELDGRAVAAVRGHSLLYGLFEYRPDGALMPVAGRERAYLGEDLPGILKYKGKTNELFTQFLVNLALYSGDFWNQDAPLNLLDPMCGRGTTLYVGANRGWNCTGADVDRADLREAEQFFKRYLEYHRFKHTLERGSLTVQGHTSAQSVQFTFSDTSENYKQKKTATLRLVNADACGVRETFGARSFHMIVCDLPYGVQHLSSGGNLETLLAKMLRGWREALKPGGTAAISFNAQTLKPDTVLNLMESAGLEPLRDEPYRQFSHWVEQAVTRDVAVARRK